MASAMPPITPHHPQYQQPYLWPAPGQPQQRSPIPTFQQPIAGAAAYQAAMDQAAVKKLHYYVVATNFDQNWYKVFFKN